MILTERAYADSASVLTLQLKEATSGVANSNALEIQKVVPLPKVLPTEKSTNSRQYHAVIKEQTGSVSFAISNDLVSDTSFVSASLLYTDKDIDLPSGGLSASSEVYRYIVIQKKGNKVSFYACKKSSSKGFLGCLPGDVEVCSVGNVCP